MEGRAGASESRLARHLQQLLLVLGQLLRRLLRVLVQPGVVQAPTLLLEGPQRLHLLPVPQLHILSDTRTHTVRVTDGRTDGLMDATPTSSQSLSASSCSRSACRR